MERIKYVCTNCSYRFLRDKDVVFKYCPYCGKPGTVSLDTGNKASQLLDEVS